MHITVGGNNISYDGETSTPTPTTDLKLTKIFLNSVISTQHSQLSTIDIKDFYLHTFLKDPEYMTLPLSIIPTDIIQHYSLHSIQNNNKIYIKIVK